MRHMVDESQRTSAVVTRLRDFFRTGDTKLDLVALDDILRSAASAFASRAERNRVDLRFAPLPGAVVFVDRLQIEVVIRNLLANAFDAVESQDSPERTVRLWAERLGSDRVCVRVEDSGPGLGKVSAGRLFEPFRSSKSSGLGLGLAISRSIAEAHGGRLWAEAASHGTFGLLLPLEQGASRESQ
jgi:C4-dicarboxylate-specific signal transduction histidine kinase